MYMVFGFNFLYINIMVIFNVILWLFLSIIWLKGLNYLVFILNFKIYEGNLKNKKKIY